jgi:hypothetical protein
MRDAPTMTSGWLQALLLLTALPVCHGTLGNGRGRDAGADAPAGDDSAGGDSAGGAGEESAATDPAGDPTGDPAGDPGPAGDGTGGLTCTFAWGSGFENGFPGEWLDYDNGSWSADGSMPGGRVSAWTIIDTGDGEPIFAGGHGYKGWIVGAASDSHRAYPGIHTNIPTPLVNTFWVYLDADYAAMSASDWIHFGTWGNWDAGTNAGLWALHTMSVRDRKLEFAHTNPFLGEYIGPQPQPDFPLRQWVRFTVYVHYAGITGTVQAWQDGVAMLRAEVSQLAANPGTALRTAHWGMYAAATVTGGVQYNDDILVWTLPAPLTELVDEPRCF